MKFSFHSLVNYRWWRFFGCLAVSSWLGLTGVPGASGKSARQCVRSNAEQDVWLARRVDDLVSAARAAYYSDNARDRYDRVLGSIARTIERCQLSHHKAEGDFAGRYPQFVEYVRVLALSLDEDRELGFEVTDEAYFAETSQYTTIPDFLLTSPFLGFVSRFEGLSKAKAWLRDVNATRTANDQLIFFSYTSRHLGTPDNPDSYRRLLIVVPGNAAQHLPEKWVQFGIPDPRRRASVRNVSVVAVVPNANETTNVYFKDYYRTYRRRRPIKIRGRWELGEGDDNCVECHKSGVLPIFPVEGSVSPEEQPLVEAVNERFRSYGTARFDKYLDLNKFGPGLGSPSSGATKAPRINTEPCTSCHHTNGLGNLNWPMDSKLISSFVKSGRMPQGSTLGRVQHAQLYHQLIQDYFAIDDSRPGILKAWLLGKSGSEEPSN